MSRQTRRSHSPLSINFLRGSQLGPARLLLALILGLVLIGCASSGSQAGTVSIAQGGEAVRVSSSASYDVVGPIGPGQDGEDSGLVFQLSDGTPGGDAAAQLPVALADPLADDETAALIARLPALTGQTGDKTDFNLPEETLPAPAPATRWRPPSQPRKIWPHRISPMLAPWRSCASARRGMWHWPPSSASPSTSQWFP